VLIFDFEKQIEFMIKNQLTADELFLIKLILYAKEGKDVLIKKYFTNAGLSKPLRDVLSDLQNKGIITKAYIIPEKNTIFNPTDVKFNKNFIKQIYQNTQDLGMELFEKYPAFVVINNTTYPLRNITKLYRSFDEFCFKYAEAINFNLEKHEEVLKLVEDAADSNLINVNIASFVGSHGWEDLKAMQEKDLGTFNTNTLL
jgi:hypothetical protein